MSNKSFDCQAAYEMKSHCDEQCDHCKEYYVDRDSLTSDDVIRLNLLEWLKKKDLPTDEIHWKSTLVTTKPILQGDNTLNAPLVISQTASTNTAQGYWVVGLKIQGGEQ